MIAAFVVAAVVGAAVGFPVDYLRRRASHATAAMAGVVNALALIAAVALIAGTGVVSGGGAVVALVFGIIAGNVAADACATAAWGPPAKHY